MIFPKKKLLNPTLKDGLVNVNEIEQVIVGDFSSSEYVVGLFDKKTKTLQKTISINDIVSNYVANAGKRFVFTSLATVFFNSFSLFAVDGTKSFGTSANIVDDYVINSDSQFAKYIAEKLTTVTGFKIALNMSTNQSDIGGIDSSMNLSTAKILDFRMYNESALRNSVGYTAPFDRCFIGTAQGIDAIFIYSIYNSGEGYIHRFGMINASSSIPVYTSSYAISAYDFSFF